MNGTLSLLDIAGCVALLPWGTPRVTSGGLRGHGSALRRWLCGEALNEEYIERAGENLTFVINIEQIGDITANDLREFAAKNAQRGKFLQRTTSRIWP